MSKQTKPTEPTSIQKIKFHLLQANDFRHIPVDGCYGGVSPDGQFIQMSVYSDRLPLPQIMTHSLVNGAVGPAIVEECVSRSGIERYIEALLIMDRKAAEGLHGWLTSLLKPEN